METTATKEKILYDSWGYSMTIVEFYKVVRETEKSVWVIPIGSTETGEGYLSGRSMPNPEVTYPERMGILRKRVTNYGTYYRGTVKSKNQDLEGHSLREWDGRSVYYNHCD